MQPDLICANQFQVHIKQNRASEDMEVVESCLNPFLGNNEDIFVIFIENTEGRILLGSLVPKNHTIIHTIDHDVVSVYQQVI